MLERDSECARPLRLGILDGSLSGGNVQLPFYRGIILAAYGPSRDPHAVQSGVRAGSMSGRPEGRAVKAREVILASVHPGDASGCTEL